MVTPEQQTQINEIRRRARVFFLNNCPAEFIARIKSWVIEVRGHSTHDLIYSEIADYLVHLKHPNLTIPQPKSDPQIKMTKANG